MRRHITPSLIISVIALFVALGGASYAAIKIPRNSVGAAQIKKNAVTSTKVKDRSLLAKDFRAGQLPRGARGATGPAGPTFSFGYSEYSTASLTYGSDPTYLVSRDIVVPRAGRMTLNFTGSFTRPFNLGSPESFDCQMLGPDGAELAPPTTSGLVSADESAQIAITGSFVAAAGTNRISVRCALTPGTGSATINVYGHSITGVLTGT